MKFEEFLLTEFDYPNELSYEDKVYMKAAWNQAVAECRRITRNISLDAYEALDDAYFRMAGGKLVPECIHPETKAKEIN